MMVSYNTQNQNLRYASSRLPKPGCHHQNLPCSLTPHGVSLKHIKPRSSCGHHRNIGCRARYDDSEWRSPPPAPTRSAPPSNSYLDTTQQAGNGVFVLLLINILIFLADKLLHVPLVQSLYLYHSNPQWYQFITCCFCHSSWEHLSTNMFMLLVFGRYVEEEGGVLGLWLTYLICGVGGALASYLSAPGSYTASLGASGAIFGLFAVGVLSKLSFNPRKLLEAFVLGQFVVSQVLQEVAAQAASASSMAYGGGQVSHVAHLGGAAAGVLLMWALSRLPEAPDGER